MGVHLASPSSHIMYGSQIWRPMLIKDIKNIEGGLQRGLFFGVQVETSVS